jgi:hypothetical protein
MVEEFLVCHIANFRPSVRNRNAPARHKSEGLPQKLELASGWMDGFTPLNLKVSAALIKNDPYISILHRGWRGKDVPFLFYIY